jgi:hypothetical protein
MKPDGTAGRALPSDGEVLSKIRQIMKAVLAHYLVKIAALLRVADRVDSLLKLWQADVIDGIDLARATANRG